MTLCDIAQKYVNESELNMSSVMMPFDRSHTVSHQSSTATISNITMYFLKYTRSHDSEHIPFRGNLSCAHLVLLCINKDTAFAVPSFTDSEDTIGGQNQKTGHVTLTMPIKGQFIIPRVTLDIFYNLYTKIGDTRFSCSGDMITSVKIENGSSFDLGHTCFRGALSTKSSDLIQSTCEQNLTTLALAVPIITGGCKIYKSSSQR